MPGIATAGRKRPQTHKGALHRPAAEWQNTLLDTRQLSHWPTPIGAKLSEARCLSTARVLFSLLAQAHHVCTWEGPTVKVATTGRIPGTHVVRALDTMRVWRRAVVCQATHAPNSPEEKNRNIAVADRLSQTYAKCLQSHDYTWLPSFVARRL